MGCKRTWLGDCFGLGIKKGVIAFDYVYIRIRVKAGRKSLEFQQKES